MFTWALPKGRLLEPVAALLEASGVPAQQAVQHAGRKLTLALPDGSTLLLVKPADVPIYVAHGVAHLGVVGSDTVEELGLDLYEPLDLGVGVCRLVLAQPHTPRERQGRALRIASKYPRLAQRYVQSQGIAAEIIALSGSVELGAMTGLADQIIDLVETGTTLRDNHLEEVQTIMNVSARLLVQPASYKLERASMATLLQRLEQAVAGTR